MKLSKVYEVSIQVSVLRYQVVCDIINPSQTGSQIVEILCQESSANISEHIDGFRIP